MDKAPEAFRTISEVAAELDIPKHVLRFWETKFPQLKPMKRGGGRRYYRPEDVDLLRGIRTLLYDEGYTIKGLQKVFRHNGVTFVKNCWRDDAQPPPRASKPPIPDIASETAEHARKHAQNKRVLHPKRATAKTAAESSAREAKGGLSPEQRRTLNMVLGELEQCRAVLAAASGKGVQQT